jgi:hypothetical protein
MISANGLLSRATRQDHLQAAGVAKQEMRLDDTEQHDQIKLRQEPIDNDKCAPASSSKSDQLGSVETIMVVPAMGGQIFFPDFGLSFCRR